VFPDWLQYVSTVNDWYLKRLSNKCPVFLRYNELKLACRAISFPEPTCLLVTAKTRSSGIIHFKSPRIWDFRFYGACVPWFRTWCLEIKSMWMRIECLWGTNPHWFYLDAFFKPKHACAVKPEVPKSWTLEMDYSRAPCLGADQKTRGLWERDCLPRRQGVEFNIYVFTYWYICTFSPVSSGKWWPHCLGFDSHDKRNSKFGHFDTVFKVAYNCIAPHVIYSVHR